MVKNTASKEKEQTRSRKVAAAKVRPEAVDWWHLFNVVGTACSLPPRNPLPRPAKRLPLPPQPRRPVLPKVQLLGARPKVAIPATPRRLTRNRACVLLPPLAVVF